MCDSESLFSLELVVDKLFVPSVTCRFPAIAFRFLDFPTLVIHHVEPEIASKIRERISPDPYTEIPAQINDLKDRNGNFLIKKGKSSLFKVSAQTLRTHLNSTPLYVMVIDTFPEVSKLVGHAVIPMCAVMERVFADLSTLGVAMPSAHGDKGIFQVCNLMGNEIGNVTLGFRLMSLGVGLIQHIPEQAVLAVESQISHQLPLSDPQKKVENKIDITPDFAVETNVASPSKKTTADANSAVDVSKKQLKTEGMQTISSQYAVQGTQTDFKKKLKQISRDIALDIAPAPVSPEDDILISNTLCPPPLYYNSESVSNPGASIFNASVANVNRKFAWNENRPTEESDASDGETIRAEDVYSDDDYVIKPKTKKKSVDKKKAHTQQSTTIVQETFQKPVHDIRLPMSTVGDQFPLLNALMSEIVAIQNQRVSQAPVSGSQTSRSQGAAASKVIPPYALPQPVYSQEKRKQTESIVPFNETAQQKSRYRECVSAEQGVPKNKSWIRKEPVYGVRKTKLTYGLTNTQRLRLALTNPELLKTLEREQASRTIQNTHQERENKELDFKTKEVPRFSSANQAQNKLNAIRIDKSKTKVLYTGERFQKSDTKRGSAGMKSTKVISPKKSKSVPRKRLQNVDEESDESVRAAPAPPISVSLELSSMNIDSPHPPDYDNDHSSPTQRSINIHIPTSSAHDGDSESESLSDFESDTSPRRPTAVNYNPGFPPDYSIHNKVAGLSSDFDNSNIITSADESELRRIPEGSERSDGSESGSYKSVLTEVSRPVNPQPMDGAHVLGHLKVMPINPVVSSQSPVVVNKLASSQQDLNESLSFDTFSSEQRSDIPTPSPRKHKPERGDLGRSSSAGSVEEPRDRPTPRPRLGSLKSKQHWSNTTSFEEDELTGVNKMAPRITPRRSETARTDSVSTYVPSDLENLGVSSTDEQYSDGFEEESVSSPLTSPDYVPWKREPQRMSDIDFKAASQLGYTC